MHFRAILQTVYDWFCGGTEPTGKPLPPPPVTPQRPPVPASQPPARRPPPSQPPRSAPRAQGRPQGAARKNNGDSEHFRSLRDRAGKEGDQMSRCFAESHEAYARGDRALAKELSNRGREHQQAMDRLNGEASEWIFRENNKDALPGEVDLHGLFVKEAIARTEQAVKEARQRGATKIHLIVGKGLHSPGNIAKLKPAIEELMQRQGFIAELDESNSGVLVVSLDGRPTGAGSVIQAADVARRVESKDDSCTIM